MIGSGSAPYPVGASGASRPSRAQEENRRAVVAVIVGVVALALCWVPPVALALGLTAISRAAAARSAAQIGLADNEGLALAARAFAVAAIVLGDLGVVVVVLLTWFSDHRFLVAWWQPSGYLALSIWVTVRWLKDD